jgi:hypothetical protein
VAELLPNDRILIVGGRTNGHDPNGFLSGMEVFDLRPGHDHTMYAKAHRRIGHTLTRLPDGRIALVGGTGADAPKEAQSTWLYDPAGDTWSFPTGPANLAPVYHTATLLAGSEILLAGGRANGFPVSPPEADAVAFDPVTGSTRALPPLHEARADHTGTRLADGRALIVGGWGKRGRLGDAEVYDPATNRWSQVAGASPRTDHTATLLADGRVLLFGGAESGPTQIFDPRAARFADTSLAPEPGRRHHTATLLPSGAVLVAGGYVEGRGAVADTAVYRPEADTWCVAAPLATPRYRHTATRLSDGRVLVVGGDDLQAGGDARPMMDPYVRSTEILREAE